MSKDFPENKNIYSFIHFCFKMLAKYSLLQMKNKTKFLYIFIKEAICKRKTNIPFMEKTHQIYK